VLATLVAVLVFAMDRDPRRRLSSLNQPVVRATLGIAALVMLSIPGSLYPGDSLQFLLKDLLRTVALMLLVTASVRGLADLRRLAWLQIAGVTLFAAVIVARSQMGSDGRLLAAAYYDVNDLATLIVCTLPLALYLWRWSDGRWARLLVTASAVLLMVTLVKTGSRGGLVGFLAVAAYVLLRFPALSRAKRLGAVALLAILLVALANDRYFERMRTILHPETDYNWSSRSETGRMEVWKRGIGYMVSHPVLGVGARAFPVAEGTLAPEAVLRKPYGRGFKWSVAHNSFIEVGAEIGVLGLALFVALFRGAFRALSRIRRGPGGEAAFLAQALAASLVGFAVTAFFLSQEYSAYFYTLLGMIVALARIAHPMRAPLVPVDRAYRRSVPAPNPVAGDFPRSGGLTRDGR
jgi:O-antigen ligase